MQPKQIRHVDETATVENKGKKETYLNRAVAPYNFIELPEDIVSFNRSSLATHDSYQSSLLTGSIKCLLTTSSPLYTRCGLSVSDFQKDISTSIEDLESCSQDERARRVDFFKYPRKSLPVIPGSSLRGMLRALVEVISFSKIERVSDENRLFFRAVAGNPKKDSLANNYKDYVNPKAVEAGYLKKDEQGWYVQPARKIQGVSFAWVREREVSIQGFKKLNHDDYEPQYFLVSYESVVKNNQDRAKRVFAENIDSHNQYPANQGVLVTSGNMKQGSEPSPRRNHCIVFEETRDFSNQLRISQDAVEHYCNALSDFQKSSPFSENLGVLKQDRPIFYYPPQGSNIVGFFGQSPNFRIPYSPYGDGKASTVVDFIPPNLRKPLTIDIADALFGFVDRETSEAIPGGSFRSRISVSDAEYTRDIDGIWFSNPSITPQILGTPKPTTFQHYLVQPEETRANKAKLRHYASKPPAESDAGTIKSGETVIRGHKLYWHKGNIQLSDVQQTQQKKIDDAKSQYTEITPVKDGVSFEFCIQFENLSSIELGALLWILKIAQDDRYRLSLGMGKPLGMGAVKMEYQVYLSDRKERYSQLFSDEPNMQWHVAETIADDQQESWIKEFEQYILDNISELDHPQQGKANHLEELPRIKMLLAMLSWKERLTLDELNERRYMEIERDRGESHVIGKSVKPRDSTVNEYKERPVLPTPLQIMDFPDERKIPDSPKDRKQSPIKHRNSPNSHPQRNKTLNNKRNQGGGGSSTVFQRGPRPPKK